MKPKNTKAPPPRQQQKKPVQRVRTVHHNENPWPWFVLGGILLATFLVYFYATSYDFLYLWDDRLYITDNSHIKDLHWENIKLFFTRFYVGNYQPVTMLSYAMEYKTGAGNAAVFHLNNILLHLANTLLVFIIIKRMAPKRPVVALITAAFFALHPMHVESVAWISERKDVLYSFFFLLALIKYTDYLQSRKIKSLVYTFAFFVLSCMSKSAAVILPLVMLLFDYYLNRKFDWKMVVEKLPFFAVSLLFGIVAIYSQKSSMHDLAPMMSPVVRLSIVSWSFISYLFKAFIPLQLSAIYPYPAVTGSTLPILYYFSVLCVAALLVFTVWSRRWGKEGVFGMAFFIITIILVLQFFPVGAATMADRYTYIPYIGLFFILGKLVDYLMEKVFAKSKNSRRYMVIALVALLFSYSVISYARVAKWENDDALFSDVIDKYPTCSTAYLNRGFYYKTYYADVLYVSDYANREIYLKKAIRDFENVLKYALVKKENWKVYDNLGSVKGDLGDIDGAINDYTTSIQLNPRNRFSYLNRGVFYLNNYANKIYMDDPKKRDKYLKMALDDFNNALKYSSDSAEKIQLYNNLGNTCFSLNDFAGAIANWDSSIQLDPANGDVFMNRGTAKFNLKKYTEALQDYSKAIELNPQNKNAITNREIVNSILINVKN